MQSNYAPDEKSSLRYAFQNETNQLNDQRSTSTGNINEQTNTHINEHEIDYFRQVWRTLRTGLGYKINDTRIINEAQDTAIQDNLTQTLKTSLEWEASRSLRSKISNDAAFIKDRRGIDPDTVTIIPRIDIVYRPWQPLSITGFLEWTHSISGVETQKKRSGLSLRWDLPGTSFMEPVFTFEFTHDASDAPTHYESLDVLAKLSLIF
jgi:hypothetical protein